MKTLQSTININSSKTLDYLLEKRFEENKYTPSLELNGLQETGVGQEGIQQLLPAIQQAREFICLASFLLDDNEVVKALEKKAQAGVKVFLLTSNSHLRDAIDIDGEPTHKTSYSKLLNERFRNKILLKASDHFHAKFLLIDPKETNPSGFLFTGNMTTKALKENPELLQTLKKQQITELFQLFVYQFWEEATHEQQDKEGFAKCNPLKRFQLPSFQQLVFTNEKHKTLQNALLDQVNSAQKSLHIAAFGFEKDHAISQAILKRLQAGVEVHIYARTRSKIIQEHLIPLAQAGAHIYAHPLLHAKCLLVDGNKGAIFTANIEKQGLENGFEIGFTLDIEQCKSLASILMHWQQQFPCILWTGVKLANAPGNACQFNKEGKLASLGISSSLKESLKWQKPDLKQIRTDYEQASKKDYGYTRSVQFAIEIEPSKAPQGYKEQDILASGISLIAWEEKRSKGKVRQSHGILLQEGWQAQALFELPTVYNHYKIYAHV